MKTGIHKVSLKRWLLVFLFNFIIVMRDAINYRIKLEERQGNLVEFTVLSLNDIYFVVLAGVISVWILTADYKEITGADILAMVRCKTRSEYFKLRMLNEGCRVFLYIVMSFLLRFIVAIMAGYPISSLWNMITEYNGCDSITMLYLIINLFTAILGYLCFFVWLRELIFAVTKHGFLRNVLPALFPITELAIYKSLHWSYIPYLPIGNVLLAYQPYSKGIIGKGTYWLLVLAILFLIRTDLNKKCDYYE